MVESNIVLEQKMDFQLIFFVLFLFVSENAESQRTFLDLKFSPLVKFGRKTLNTLIEPQSFERGLELNRRDKKVQKQFLKDSQFFCDVNVAGRRSKSVPQSVHELRPGDIDIVGAIGDSLTAGNGAFALNPLQVLLEARGSSWSIGGQKTWQQFLTLPNILKIFNPKLYGYPTNGNGNADQKSSVFNVASAGV